MKDEKARVTPGQRFVKGGATYEVLGDKGQRFVSLDRVEAIIRDEWEKTLYWEGNGKWISKLTIQALERALGHEMG